jgi:hypothetical protein
MVSLLRLPGNKILSQTSPMTVGASDRLPVDASLGPNALGPSAIL